MTGRPRRRGPGSLRGFWLNPDVDRGCKLLFAWMLALVLVLAACATWSSWLESQGRPAWPPVIPAALLLFGPGFCCAGVLVRQRGWREGAREVWLLTTRRHEVFDREQD